MNHFRQNLKDMINSRITFSIQCAICISVVIFIQHDSFLQPIPTLNGLFDNERYQVAAINNDGEILYYVLDNNTLYLTSILDQSLNDNIFDARPRSYVASVNWTINAPIFKDLYNNDRLIDKMFQTITNEN